MIVPAWVTLKENVFVFVPLAETFPVNVDVAVSAAAAGMTTSIATSDAKRTRYPRLPTLCYPLCGDVSEAYARVSCLSVQIP